MNEETPIKLLTKGEIQMVVGGYWDGRLVLQNFTKKYEVVKKKHLYRITCIEVSESEEMIITGTEKGDVAKWTLEKGTLKFERQFFHHEDAVTNACISENLGVFATCSKD